MNPQQNTYSNERFINFLIYKYPELKDLISFLPWSQLSNEIKKILAIKIDDESIEEFHILWNNNFNKIYLFMQSWTKNKRIQFFKEFLSNVAKDIYKNNTDDLYKSLRAIEIAYDEYKTNFSVQWDNVELFQKIIDNNQYIKLSNFCSFYDYNISKTKQTLLIWWRYWVWKTVFSVNVIKDILINNKDVVVIYFGTNEVSKDQFILRMMTNMSSYDIQRKIKERNNLNTKKDELQDIVKMLDLDFNSSIKFLKKNVDVSFYETLLGEDKENSNRIAELEKEISDLSIKIVWTNQKDYINENVKRKKSWINSIELKKNDIMKNFILSLENNDKIFEIIEEIYKDSKVKNNDIQINFELIRSTDKNSAHINLESIISELHKLVNFLSLIEWTKFNESIQNNIKKTYESFIKDYVKQIEEIDKILHDEYTKVVNFLWKEHVEIYDQLHINFIEQKLKLAREKFPTKKMVVIIDYQQKVDWLSTVEFEHSKMIWDKFLNLCWTYDCFWIMMSQLNDPAKTQTPWQKWPSFRPTQSNIRGWEWVAQNVWWIWIIFNRDYFDLKIEDLSNIDTQFVIYEIYLTKNRYWSVGYNNTKQYFIFDKKQLSYLAINKKFYKLLDENKEIQYLDQFKAEVSKQFPQMTNIDSAILA